MAAPTPVSLIVPWCVVWYVPADIQLACLAAPILCIPNDLATTWLPPLDSLPQELRELVQVRRVPTLPGCWAQQQQHQLNPPLLLCTTATQWPCLL